MTTNRTNPSTPAKPARTNRHNYKIGIIGAKNSGKTCLLAVLGMPHSPNSSSFSVTRAAVGKERDPRFGEGDARMNEAKDSLDKGMFPDATNPKTGHENYALRFDFGDGRNWTKRVDMFDYAGDLLDPELIDSDLSTRLQQALGDMDGLIVLAEFPKSPGNGERLEVAFGKIMRSFAKINNEGKRNGATVPIAMLINKWDRSPDFDPNASIEDQATLQAERFLNANPPPYHKAVADTLKSIAGGDRFRIFPVSAINMTRADGGREAVPRTDVMPCSWIEDPFIWLIGQIDSLRLDEAATILGSSRSWLPLRWPYLFTNNFWHLNGRIRPPAEESRRFALLRRKSIFAFCTQVLCILVFACLVETGLLFRSHRTAMSKISDASSDRGWREGVDWLNSYGRSSFLRVTFYRFVLPKGRALAEADRVTSDKDTAAFDLAVSAEREDRLSQAESMIQEQLKQFPNSPFNSQRLDLLGKIDAVRTEAAFKIQMEKWTDRIMGIRRQLEEATQVSSVNAQLDQIKELKLELDSQPVLPHPKVIRDGFDDLRSQIKDTRTEAISKVALLNVRDGIQSAMLADEYKEAANLLAKHPEHKDLLDDFRRKFVTWLETLCEVKAQDGASWQAARAEAKAFLDPFVREVVGTDNLAAVLRTIQKYEIMGDMFLYKLARDGRNHDSLNTYINGAPVKSMIDEVMCYLGWLEKREKAAPITFRLVKIHWGAAIADDIWSDNSTKIKLFVNGGDDKRNPDIEANDRAGVMENKNGIRMVELTDVSQTQQVGLNVQIWGHWDAKVKLAKGDDRRSPEGWLENPHLQDNMGSTYTIKVGGVLPEPDLPAWHLPK